MSAKEQDQSMEEILQSIKRIIADEGESAPGGSDVLELTDMIAPAAAPEPAPEPVFEPAPEPEPAAMSIDEIMAMPVEPVAPAPAAPEPAPTMAFSNEGLVSNTAVSSSAAALKTLMDAPNLAATPTATTPSVQFRSGVTVEDLVVESLKPMLKEWLDANLPQLVEKLVEREIKRIVALSR